MADLTAKRTLVKSPPELWTELSELEALARHLDGFGEIRITRVEPETTVAWEGEKACGTVELEASGWGTKVTLTAAVTEPPEQAEPSREELTAPERAAGAPVPRPVVDAEPDPPRSEPPPPVVDAEPVPPRWEPARPAPRPRRGLLTRLFGRSTPATLNRAPMRRAPGRPLAQPPRGSGPPSVPDLQRESAQAPDPAGRASPQPDLGRETEANASARRQVAGAACGQLAGPTPAQESPQEAEAHTAAFDDEHALAVLESVLDNLGSAHHRPFSRK